MRARVCVCVMRVCVIRGKNLGGKSIQFECSIPITIHIEFIWD